MLQSCRYPGRLMLQSCRYPGPSGWEWERNSGVLPLVALIVVDPVCSRFSVSAVICQCFDLSVRLSRVHRWVVSHGICFGCPWYPGGPVGPFGLLLQRRLLVAQCDLRFNRLAQGAVDQADSLDICRCILGPSAQGESRI